jgi:hypothetical protein
MLFPLLDQEASMPEQPEKKNVFQETADAAAQKAATAAAEAAARQAAASAIAGISRAADSALDALEKALFGKVGGAEEAIQADSGKPLEVLRAKYGIGEAGKEGPEATEKAEAVKAAEEDPVARARAQLEALKKARTQGAEPAPPSKKTL